MNNLLQKKFFKGLVWIVLFGVFLTGCYRIPRPAKYSSSSRNTSLYQLEYTREQRRLEREKYEEWRRLERERARRDARKGIYDP